MVTPVHSTDVCCSRIRFSKMRPQVSMHVAPHVPTRCESSRFTPPSPLRRADRRWRSVVFSDRRSIDVPLMLRRPAGFPGRTHECVHRRRPAEAHALLKQAQPPGRTRGPRPPPPSRVNGSWLGYGPKHLLAPPRSLAPATRCGRLPAFVLLGRTTERWRKELLPCHRPSRHNRAPISAQVRALLTDSGLMRTMRRLRLRSRASCGLFEVQPAGQAARSSLARSSRDPRRIGEALRAKATGPFVLGSSLRRLDVHDFSIGPRRERLRHLRRRRMISGNGSSPVSSPPT